MLHKKSMGYKGFISVTRFFLGNFDIFGQICLCFQIKVVIAHTPENILAFRLWLLIDGLYHGI